jgi:hypothetical protein
MATIHVLRECEYDPLLGRGRCVLVLALGAPPTSTPGDGEAAARARCWSLVDSDEVAGCSQAAHLGLNTASDTPIMPKTRHCSCRPAALPPPEYRGDH